MISAAVYSGTHRNIRRKSGSFSRSRWRGAIVCVVAIGGLFVLNWIYQVIRKPGELLAPISASLSKSPESTWESYGPLFEKHSTSILSPEFLAAIAQVEGNGNPIARTYWRWRWSWNPFEIYRPASSALGMFQITDGTFAEARKYCIRDHNVVTDGPWHDLRSCWFNSFYSRTLPSHSIEMTAGYLHQSVANTLPPRNTARVSLAQKQELAAVIHLCGLKRGGTFVTRGFRVTPGERCGTHSLSRYLIQVDRMKKRFARLRKGSGLSEPAPPLAVISGSARFNRSKVNSTP
ncbi:MAG TPA: lytic transglycosylase domain-containing protein [Candidatus Binatia bacterium]|nr:lytic transglycosylase domain-containing protein [Candidatus Binatia bacterium]